jgi:hypothetical protein
MTTIDEQLAALHAEANAKAAELVAQANAEKQRKALSDSALTDDELASALDAYDTATGKSAPHEVSHIHHRIIKHLLTKVRALEGASE